MPVLPGVRAPHELADFLLERPCPTCAGEGREKYFSGEMLRAMREGAEGWSLRRMSREIGIPASSLSRKEREMEDFTEDQARAFLVALGVL